LTGRQSEGDKEGRTREIGFQVAIGEKKSEGGVGERTVFTKTSPLKGRGLAMLGEGESVVKKRRVTG